MSIRKLFGTAACMVIIGVSAGVSYGQFQRLTAQVATSPMAVNAQVSQTITPTTSAAVKADFLDASSTNWTAAAQSGVTIPSVNKPVTVIQPEPPIQAFETNLMLETSRSAPALAGLAAIAEPIIFDRVPDAVRSEQVVNASTIAPAALGFTATPHASVKAGSLPRFRNHAESENDIAQSRSNRDDDGSFERTFPEPRVAAAPLRPRVNVPATTRAAVRRQVRFQRLWSTGVYR